MDDFGARNRAYAEPFAERYPARATIGVAALPSRARVARERIAADPPRA